MTIEIQELIIQARVTDSSNQSATHATSWASLERAEQDRLVEQLTRRVLECLRDEQEQQ
ncbi:DUF5908 family protein [Pseudomonas sp. NFIX28]|uniref:DUF5908 family protein n=1 Tax=Pseudomonas sp. NFIX28 TaxID=1566235 RepID=UPI00089A5E30|nr:DUF5908 family protein [Pseudomonas sp. NFIX28]SDY37898.1 hypothetical protein SAMN03159453_00421 [Pseudomonas sp. NFIX28]